MSIRLPEVFPANILTPTSGGNLSILNIIQPASVIRCSRQEGRIRLKTQGKKIRRALQGCRQIRVPRRGKR